MSKIVQAINSMIENHDNILDVTKIDCSFNNGEYSGYYFKFLRYIWSIKTYIPKAESSESGEKGPWGVTNAAAVMMRQAMIEKISVKNKREEFALVYYPDYSDVMCLDNDLKNGIYPNGIPYTTEMDQTKEAYESYTELYRIIREKLYNVDNVLNDIISLIDKSEQ